MYMLLTDWINNSHEIGKVSLSMLMVRLIFNLIVLWLLAYWCYFRSYRQKEFLFSFYLIGTVVFFLSFLLYHIEVHIGVAIGLFAIFGILRYRTDQIPVIEMTYLFGTVGVSIANALLAGGYIPLLMILINVTTVTIALVYEKYWKPRQIAIRIIKYDKPGLLSSDLRRELFADLEARTGIKEIVDIEIGRIDLVRNTANLRIIYRPGVTELPFIDADDSDS